MLNFDKGLRIARIEKGKYNGNGIYISDNDVKCCIKCTPECSKRKKCCVECSNLKENARPITDNTLDVFNDQYFRNKKKRMNVAEISKLKKALMRNIEPIMDDEIMNIYREAKTDYDVKNAGEFSIDEDGKVIPCPALNDDSADHVYISGPTNSGKSTFCNLYVREIINYFPDKDIFVFSTFKDDESLDQGLRINRIEINDELVKNPINREELADSICIFDDIDTIPKYATAIQSLRNDLLENGRKDKIRVICTSHLLMNYKHTRTCLNSCQKIVFFPKATSPYHVKRFLTEYCGLPRQVFEYIKSLPSKWILIHKSYPNYLLHEKGVIMLDKIEDLLNLQKKGKYSLKKK